MFSIIGIKKHKLNKKIKIKNILIFNEKSYFMSFS